MYIQHLARAVIASFLSSSVYFSNEDALAIGESSFPNLQESFRHSLLSRSCSLLYIRYFDAIVPRKILPLSFGRSSLLDLSTTLVFRSVGLRHKIPCWSADKNHGLALSTLNTKDWVSAIPTSRSKCGPRYPGPVWIAIIITASLIQGCAPP